MKIRKGFVSNSSSASFIVEVKGTFNDLIPVLYENIFTLEKCISLLEKKIEMDQQWKVPTKDASDRQKAFFLDELNQLENRIQELKNYKPIDWIKIKGTNIKEEELARLKEKHHQKRVVKDALEALNWTVSQIDDGYVSFNAGGTSCYNGWENIVLHKELIELIGFFTFMKYELRTRIEHHEGSF